MSAFTQPYHDAAAQLTGAGAPFEVVSRDLDGVSVKAFRNAASRLDHYLDGGRRHGAAPLLHYQGSNWSFDNFFRAVDRLSNWLRSEAGTASGTRVAIAMRNRPEWLVAFVAVVNAGATAVLLNSWGRANVASLLGHESEEAVNKELGLGETSAFKASRQFRVPHLYSASGATA